MAKPLATHPLLLFREFTPERSLICVENVANPLAVLQNWLHSREIILERRLINVESVTKLLFTVPAVLFSREFILERSLRDVWNFLYLRPAVRTYFGKKPYECGGGRGKP